MAHTRASGDTDQARTQIHGAQKRTLERKENKEEALMKELRDGAEAEKPAHVVIQDPSLTRATSLHSVALRAATID